MVLNIQDTELMASLDLNSPEPLESHSFEDWRDKREVSSACLRKFRGRRGSTSGCSQQYFKNPHHYYKNCHLCANSLQCDKSHPFVQSTPFTSGNHLCTPSLTRIVFVLKKNLKNFFLCPSYSQTILRAFLNVIKLAH